MYTGEKEIVKQISYKAANEIIYILTTEIA